MMSRKWLASFVAMLVATWVATARADVLIGDFETGLDGWEAQSDNAGPNPGPTVSALAQNANAEISGVGGIYKNGVQDPTGQVLRVLPGLANFWAITLNEVDRPNLAAEIAANRLLRANVTFRVAPFTQGNFGAWNKIALNGQPAGWQESADPPGTGGAVAWNTGLGIATYQLQWDLSAMAIPNIAAGSAAQIVMSLNYDRGSYSAQANGPAFYIDNIRLAPVPEASSIALLGLGALGVVVRRRRA